jgi:hypothetical protein
MIKINRLTVDMAEDHETQQKLVSLQYMEMYMTSIGNIHPD